MSIGHFGFAVGPYRLQPNDSDPLGLRVYIQDKELVWLCVGGLLGAQLCQK